MRPCANGRQPWFVVAPQLSSDPPSIESYQSYLKQLKKVKEDSTLINTLYQRAVAHHPLNTSLWHEYTTFLVSVHTPVIVGSYRHLDG